MLYIDVKYVSLIAPYLENFKQKNQYLWNFKCPVCGDSKRKKSKTRGYIFRLDQNLLFKCHNAGCTSMSLGNLLKQLNLTTLYNEYIFEKFQSDKSHQNKVVISTEIKEKPIISEFSDDNLSELERMDKLPKNHPAVKYLADRHIPEVAYDRLYLCHKYKKWCNSVKHYFDVIENDHPRLVIPYFTEHGKMFMFAARAFSDKEEPKYYNVKLDTEREKIYGMDRIDFSKLIYVVEGPLDSLFLDNAIAVSGVNNFDSPSIQQIKTNAILIIDREPRNPEIVKTINKYINEGYRVCLLPDTIEQKDINEMILAGKSKEDIQKLIEDNTFSGLEARVRLSDWKKCNVMVKSKYVRKKLI